MKIEKIKKKINFRKTSIILKCVLISFLVIFVKEHYLVCLNDSKIISQSLIALLGLCFAGYGLIIPLISKIETVSDQKKKKKEDLINELKSDIDLIFKYLIIILIIDVLYYINIPLLYDVKNIEIIFLNIISLKEAICCFCTSFFFMLSLYNFYDIFQVIFVLSKLDI